MPRKKKADAETKVIEKKIVKETTETPVEETHETKKRGLDKSFVHGTGRRKTAIASIFLWEEKGNFTVNDKSVDEFFLNETEQNAWLKPFHLIGVAHPKAKYKGSIKVQGSGVSSQNGAITLAVSRALAKLSEEYKVILAKAGLLTRDPRMVERKKYFLHKARKRPQYSKR